jgi:hypothetical protein
VYLLSGFGTKELGLTWWTRKKLSDLKVSRYGTIKHEEPDEVMGKKQLQHEGPDDRR